MIPIFDTRCQAPGLRRSSKADRGSACDSDPMPSRDGSRSSGRPGIQATRSGRSLGGGPGKPAVLPDRRDSVPARPPGGCGLPGYPARPALSVRRPPGLDRLVSRRVMGRSPSALAQLRWPRFTATVISPAVEPRPRPGIPGLASRRHHDYAELSVQSTRCRTSTAKIDHDQALVLVNRR